MVFLREFVKGAGWLAAAAGLPKACILSGLAADLSAAAEKGSLFTVN
jgi:hypothetical protein